MDATSLRGADQELTGNHGWGSWATGGEALTHGDWASRTEGFDNHKIAETGALFVRLHASSERVSSRFDVPGALLAC